MRLRIVAACAAVGFAAGAAAAGEIVSKPIDTTKLVVQPTQAAASLAAQTIQLAGVTTAQAAEGNGYIKTINNLFSVKRWFGTPTQAGGLPQPYVYPSTQYKSFNTPQMPVMGPARR